MKKILFAIALHAEAKPLIDFYRLKKVFSSPFDIYENESISVIITGIGILACAMGVSYAFGRHSYHYSINLGIAGSSSENPLGTLYHIHSVHEDSKTHYLEMLYNFSLPQHSLTTSSCVINFPKGICDMEASGFIQASRYFLPLSRIMVFKVISDHGDVSTLTKESISSLIHHSCYSLFNQLETLPLTPVLPSLDDVARCLGLTHAQLSQLHTVLKHALFQGRSIELHDYEQTVIHDKHQRQILFHDILKRYS